MKEKKKLDLERKCISIYIVIYIHFIYSHSQGFFRPNSFAIILQKKINPVIESAQLQLSSLAVKVIMVMTTLRKIQLKILLSLTQFTSKVSVLLNIKLLINFIKWGVFFWGGGRNEVKNNNYKQGKFNLIFTLWKYHFH